MIRKVRILLLRLNLGGRDEDGLRIGLSGGGITTVVGFSPQEKHEKKAYIQF